MCSNKVEYSTYTGPYCTTHDVKVPFFILDYSIREIIWYHFRVVNNEGESGIVYNMIIGCDMMV